MTHRLFITVFLSFLFSFVHGQKKTSGDIKFVIDTLDGEKISNRSDSAYINFDGGFTADTVTIIVDNKIKSKSMFSSGESTSYAGYIAVPKTKQMTISIDINGRTFQPFKFNKKFCVIHFNYYDNKLQATYTDRVYVYD
jgi:hypothetical protein